jgi:hypothetical protein
MSKKDSNIFISLTLSGICFFFIFCFISSCGKGKTVLPVTSNTLYQVINLSPDLLPVDLYIDLTKRNSSSFTYPNPSGYFSLASIDTPFQIRSSSVTVSTGNIIAIDTPLLKSNVKYTLFITGLRSNNSIKYMLTIDTSATPTVGRGKVRFVNASPGSTPFDVTANSTLAFGNQPYRNVSKFIELPAGTYDFKIMLTGSSANVISDLPGVTVQDGKLYTLYCRGIVGRTDSAAFGMSVLTHN